MFRKVLPLLALLVAGSLFSVSCGNSSGTMSKMRKERGVRVGMVPFQAPMIFQKQEFVGPDAELVKRIHERLAGEVMDSEAAAAFQIYWVPRPHASLVPALHNREIDMIVGAFGITDERKGEVAFSEPYYQSELVLIINPGHRDLRPNVLDRAKVGVPAGSATEHLVRQKYPDVNIVPFNTLDDAVLALRRSEVDAVIDDRNMAAYALDTVPGVGGLEVIPSPIATIDCAVAVRREDARLLEIVNQVVSEVKSENLVAAWLEEHQGDRVARVEERHPKRVRAAELAEQPRQVLIRIQRGPGSRFDIYRVANLPFTLTNQGSGQSYTSSRIDFHGAIGMSSATVPPGAYVLALPRFNLRAQLVISPMDPNQVSVNIMVQQDGSVVIRKG
jgi:polar amino acid transport system substrate-binding protein